ncbi:guanine nucleotide exchange factor DBS-like isoform X2 [Planococcus citri]|uniref:guanine nucleotide exchange factor DBS-like isoform X2 n=1 Tax=Planococcus citri TaxID=170843 RepID=UPI0031F76C6A
MPGIEIGNGSDEMESIPITDIAELLLQQYVIISGGKTEERCPIVTFPDNGLFRTLSDSDYRRLISYITAVPSLHEADNGFVLIVDRRNDKWTSVKHILFKFTEFFPGLIHLVYVIRPSSFFQKAVSEISNTFFKEDFKFKVVVCDNVEELHQFIDKSELSSHLNGNLPYFHEDWIQQRIALEQFSLQMRSISQLLDDFTQFVRNCSSELPDNIDDAVNQLADHTAKYDALKESIQSSSKKGEDLLNDMKQGNPSSQLPPSAINNISAVERLLVQLDETEKIFDEFWDHHASQLKQCLELRTFEKDFEKIKEKLVEYLKIASEMNETGESVEHVDTLIEELNKFHTLCQANKWCSQGIEMLGSQNIEKYSMFPEKVENVLTEMEQFVASADKFNVSGSDDLYTLFQDSINPETKALVAQVLQRIEDVTVMCEKRITNFRRLIVKPNRPVQTVSPEISVINTQEEVNVNEKENANCFSNGVTEKSGDLKNGFSHDEIIELIQAHSKQHHILKELLDTERVYVSEIKTILRGYKDMLTDVQMKSIVPNEFVGKEDTLFCNLEELHQFHGDKFLPELSSFILDVGKVANLFVDQQDEFLRLYSFYCQNKIKSDKLREKVGERNEFFLGCQLKLGHKLPLAAYMLKPVQRITKYQLLLKDLINNVDDDKHIKELQQAVDCMLLVLKCVNDRMHQISITGFKGDICEQGEMLLQAPFNVWVENKKDLLKELRLKPLRRHIFLYRKAMLFCKKSSVLGKGEYQFKGILKMSKIGLTEMVKGDSKKFEVWLEGRQEIYTIQASTVEQKDTWVREIKKVLFEQLTELKGEKLKQYAEKWPYRTFSLDNAQPPSSGSSSRGTSRPNSHHEISDDSSSELSNSDDEDPISNYFVNHSKFVALADYCASGQNEVSLKEGDKVELLRSGSVGWLYVKVHNSNSEGWVPRSYLEATKDNRKAVRHSVASSSSQQSFGSQNSADVNE